MLVSMVMAVYNGESYLKGAIDNLLDQTYSNLEIIIVNDGSTDLTKTILDAITDKRVRVIHIEQNQGAANALNIGIKGAKGEWIAIQDADDKSYPTRIEEQVKYIYEHPELIGVGTLVKCLSGDDDVSDEVYDEWTTSRNVYISRNEIRKIIYWCCPLTHSSVLFSKQAFLEVGGYDANFKIAYDYDLWLRLLDKGELEKIPIILIEYCIRRDSLSHKNWFATVGEMQVAASRAIFQVKSQGKPHQPKVIVIGQQQSCENYLENIFPLSGLQVSKIIYKNKSREISSAIRKIKSGGVDAIIVLDYDGKQKILRKLGENGLKLNKDVYVLIN